jgi:eukaryotic-like serine/threonine-protein kinase
LATGGYDKTVRLWDVAEGSERNAFSGEANVNRVAFFPDGQTVAAAATTANQVWLWNCEPRVRRQELDGPTLTIYSVAVRGDGRMVAASGYDGTARLWDLDAKPPRRKDFVLYPKLNWVAGLALSPDGRYLATGNPDGTIYVLRLATLGKTAQFPSPKG